MKVGDTAIERTGTLSDDTAIGAQLQRHRRDASLTQEELAERAGVSVDLVSKLERGKRQSARLVSLMKIAAALDVDLSDLIGRRPRLGQADDVRVLALRDAILEPGVLPGITDDDTEPPALADLERAVRAAWADYWSGRLTRLIAVVPGLLGEARMASRQHGVDATRAVSQAYRVAACLLVHLGKDDLATMAAERAVIAASNDDDRLLWASANATWAWCVHHQGRLDVAERHALRVAHDIEPDFARSPLPRLTVWGGLIITALAAAAAAERAAEVKEYLGLARTGTGRLDADRNDYETQWGPTQVSVQATHAHVMLRQPDLAMKAARHVERADLRDIAWGRHLLDRASAHAEARHFRAAEATLADAEAMSPEWFSQQGPARLLVSELRQESQRLSPTLRRLARTVAIDR